MRKILFIDRDGTLVVEPPDKQIDSVEKLEFYPGVFTWLAKIAQRNTYDLVLVSNQDGLGTSSFPHESFLPAHRKIIKTLEGEGIRFTAEHIDTSRPEEQKFTRKPGIGMLLPYFHSSYDIANSIVIGDRVTDLELARNLGCKGILLSPSTPSGLEEVCILNTTSWQDIYEHLFESPRKVSLARSTNETQVVIDLNLDGKGESQINTGIGFFDHMLEQFAKHSAADMALTVKGDMHIDEHHTIEDTGIALGQAIRKALDDKRGIERYGFYRLTGEMDLIMDDCLASSAIDLGGRPWLEWKADFKREKLGAMPTEMIHHFFKSFTDAALCNLSIKAEGINEHHKAEAIFKSVARALKMAKHRDTENPILPTTKGLI